MRKVLKFIKDYWITGCIYLAMFFGYKYIADNQLFGGYLFPAVSKVANSFKENIGTLFMNMFYSFQLMIPAIIIAVVIAIVGGTILGMSKKIRKVVHPVVYSISVIPSILMSPFALLMAPSFRIASLFLVVYNTIWATFFATINGIMTIDKVYLDKAKTLELNPVEKMFQVILPAAMPSIMSGFITSLRGSFVVLVYAEMYGAKFGMGFYVKKFAEYGLYSEAWSGFIFMVDPYHVHVVIDRLAAVREAVGPDVDIIMENHSYIDAQVAVQLGEQAKKYNILFFEEPTTPNPKMNKFVCDKLNIPIAQGERIYSRWGYAPYFEDGSIQLIQPDIGNCGGLTEAKKICDLAHIYDVGVQAHVCASPLSTAVALQLEAAIPNFTIHEHHVYNRYDYNKKLCKYDYQPVDGYIAVPDFPGIGNELTDYCFTNGKVTTIE